MSEVDPTLAETHFAFGRNWASYARSITEAEINEAEHGLLRLLGGDAPRGARFLDIGSGSGLHSIAALRLGATYVHAVDIDEESVETTRTVLTRFATPGQWEVERASVFDMTPERFGEFDVVYSWGVLHHTGDLDRALRSAAKLVAPEGKFVVALYRRVAADFFWRLEKRWYAKAPAASQARARAAYFGLFRLGLWMTGRSFAGYSSAYRGKRGMDLVHDVHDWLGGWPYQSISEVEIDRILVPLGLRQVRSFTREGRFFGRHIGVLGSGCDEFVYRRL